MRKRSGLRFFVGVFVVGAVLLVAYVQVQHLWQARHPAVKEHLDELIDAAVKRTGCARENVKVVAEEPTRARIEGCKRTVTFRWGRERIKRTAAHWHEIDPTCRVDYMGCSLPCE